MKEIDKVRRTHPKKRIATADLKVGHGRSKGWSGKQ